MFLEVLRIYLRVVCSGPHNASSESTAECLFFHSCLILGRCVLMIPVILVPVSANSGEGGIDGVAFSAKKHGNQAPIGVWQVSVC